MKDSAFASLCSTGIGLSLWFTVSMSVMPGLMAVEDTADSENRGQTTVSFSQQIEPIFRQHCQGCHQPAKAQGEWIMTDFESLLKAGESGEPAVVAGDPDASYLMQQVTPTNGSAEMPKNAEPLQKEEVELIRRWIAEGAIDDSPEASRLGNGPQYSNQHPPEYRRPPVITSIAFSPDGRWMATSGFQEVFLIDTASWQTKQRLVGLSERIESISFAPDSKRLAVTGGSPGRLGEVQIWDVETGELLLSRQVSYDTIYGGCFSPDGQLVAFGCADNTVRAIDAETGEQKLHQGAHEDWILACVFNPDGSHLVSAGRDMTVKLTEVETERFVDNITSITPGALRGGINTLAMHPDRNEVVVGGADGSPKVYRLFRQTERRIGDDANLIRRFPSMTGRIFSVAVSRDGRWIAAASTLDNESLIRVYPYDFDGELPIDVKQAMAKRVAERSPEEVKRIEDYQTAVSEVAYEWRVEHESLYSVSFSPAGDFLAAGGSEGLIRIFDTETGQQLKEFAPIPLQATAASRQTESEQLAAGNGLRPSGLSLLSSTNESDVLPKAKLLGLSVEPQQISFDSSDDYAQLVVSAQFSGGETYDVTRICQTNLAEPVADVSSLGLVRPTQPGTSQLEITFRDASCIVDIKVAGLEQSAEPDFIQDVNPILSRLGCNSGTCHGAQNGKNGFKLSLRGYDPLGDVRSLSDDLAARRLNTAAPDSSLMLLKPTGGVPHEGGVLMTPDSVHYAVLHDWISQGAHLNLETAKVASIEVYPPKPIIQREGSWQQFRVLAHYPDGSTRDVTHEAFVESGNTEICVSYEGGRVQALRRGEAPILARYEGAYAAATVTVMGDRTGFTWSEPPANNAIDRLVAAKWKRMKIQPSGLCEDHEFLRRIRLDLTGLPPTAEEVRGFLADPRPSRIKRQLKIDELIGSHDYIEHWTNKWADLLQVNSKFLGREGAGKFRDWIRQAVAENRPYDEFAREILTAEGSNKENPAASYYKILRDPDLMMENTTHLFMAVRFNCNKCHDHPFERWTQDQYYELAAFFARTGLRKDPASGNQRIGGTAVEGAKPLYEEVFDKPEGEITHARTGKQVAPAFPFDCDFQAAEDATRREQLAAWLTSPDNPYFAKSMVNRLWGYLTGTGLMEPLDDLRAGNPPTNPELLEHLTQEFIRTEFDVEHMLRLICNSRAYQQSVETNRWNDDDELNYSHAKARRLPAEVLYDAVYHVTGAVSKIPGVEPGTRAAALPDVAIQLPDGFLNNLGRPVRESACECERSEDLQLGPVMALVSGPTVGTAISDPQCDLAQLAAEEQLEDADLVREIYLRVLGREATEAEVRNVLSSSDQILADHRDLTQRLEEREAWWKEEKQRREAERLKKLEQARLQLAAREQEIAPQRQQLEQARKEELAAAEKALSDYSAASIELASDYLEDIGTQPHWFPLAPASLKATQGDTLIPQEDRSIVAKGDANKGTYEVTFRTPLRAIRGLRLEALPQPGIKGGGPGQPGNGNFVLTEIEVLAASATQPDQAKPVKIAAGKVDFAQDGFSAEQAFDGNSRNQKGWAISPRGGTVHWATFRFAEPVDAGDGDEAVLTVKLHQFHNAAQHRLARFRISVTTDDGDLPIGLPEAFLALSKVPAEKRDAVDLSGLVSYLKVSDKEWLALKQAVAEARKPLPEDEQVVSLRKSIERLEQETADDSALVQLRIDHATSQRQLQNRRLTLAQDLTWALINSPAFLFNY